MDVKVLRTCLEQQHEQLLEGWRRDRGEDTEIKPTALNY